MAKTYISKQGDIETACYLFDAENKILGRLATRIAMILMGKTKATYTPHMLSGDRVVVINAKGIKVTGRKIDQKTYDYYTGFQGGRRVLSFREMLEKHPEKIISEAVRKMLPKNRLAEKMIKRLHVYPGPE